MLLHCTLTTSLANPKCRFIMHYEQLHATATWPVKRKEEEQSIFIGLGFTGERLGIGLTMNLILLPTPTVSPTAIAPPLGSIPMIPLIRKSFASSCDSSLKSSGATASVKLLLTSSLQIHTQSHRQSKGVCKTTQMYKSSLYMNFISSCGPTMDFAQGDADVTLCREYALFGLIEHTMPSNNDTSTPVPGYGPVLGTSLPATVCVCQDQAAVKGKLVYKTVYAVCLCAR